MSIPVLTKPIMAIRLAVIRARIPHIKQITLRFLHLVGFSRSFFAALYSPRNTLSPADEALR